MTIQQLEYLIALDNHRHFVTAAEKCFVTQPTITLQLKKLEDEIGIQIFDRSTSPLKPTEMGQVIVDRAKSIMLEVNQLKEMINHEKENLKGSFKIGIIPTISPYIIPEFIGAFSDKYPDTYLDIEEMQSEEIISGLNKNNLDIGILVSPVNESSIREISLYNEPFIYYGEKKENKDTISNKEVEMLDGLWLMNSGHCFRNQVLNICDPSVEKRKINFRSGSIDTLIKMVDHYGGFTLIPELASKMMDKKKLLHFEEPKPVRTVSLMVHKGFVKEALLDALRKEILEVIPASFEQNQRFFRVQWR